MLKIYQNFDEFNIELEVLESLQKKQNEDPSLTGFPKIISTVQGDNSFEILMEALGPSLGKLHFQLNPINFSKNTIFRVFA